MRSILVVLLDGLGDRADPAHGGRTANEAAETPNLDALAAVGTCGLLWPLGPGRAPSSEVAHWAILGCRDAEFPGRGVLEALGHGREVREGDVVGYAALRTSAVREGAVWATGRARPGDAADAAALLGALPAATAGDIRIEPAALLPERGEGVLTLSGPADDRITDTDPFFRDRHPVTRPLPLVPEAAATGAAVETWTQWARRTLARHPINRARARRGAAPLDLVTLKWWGRRRPVPSLRDRQGLDGVIAGASPFLAGLAATLGMRFVPVAEGDDPAEAIRRRIAVARAALDDGATFVLCHLKATDEAGHTKDPAVKRATIEAADRALGELATRFADVVVCVTGDHATPTSPEVIHSGDPVPFLVAGPGVRADAVTRFGELDFAAGLLGRITGADVLPVLLNAADRPRFLGARPTPVPGAAGAPAEVDPLPAY